MAHIIKVNDFLCLCKLSGSSLNWPEVYIHPCSNPCVCFLLLQFHDLSWKELQHVGMRRFLWPFSFHMHSCCLVISRVWLFCDPVDYSWLGSSVHGTSQSRILEWVPIFFSRGSSLPRNQTSIPWIGRQILYHWATTEVLHIHCCCQVTSVVSNSVPPHRWQPTRLPHPWDSPGKNTEVVCHFLLQCMKVKIESEVAQSCPTLSDPMDCSLLGSSVHGIFQARVLEWA